MGFTLCNASSINLNFVLYVMDIYKKELKLTDEFLSKDEFYPTIPDVWNGMIKKFRPINGRSPNTSFIFWDKELLKERDSYRILFKDTEKGYKKYLNVWDEYSNWWYNECQDMLNKEMDEFIPTIYKLVKDKLITNKKYLPSGDFAIQIIFSEIPENSISNGTLFTIESIKNFSSNLYIYEISNRLYELILSRY